MATMLPPRSIPDIEQSRRQTVRPHAHPIHASPSPGLSPLTLLDLLPGFNMLNTAKVAAHRSDKTTNTILCVLAAV